MSRLSFAQAYWYLHGAQWYCCGSALPYPEIS